MRPDPNGADRAGVSADHGGPLRLLLPGRFRLDLFPGHTIPVRGDVPVDTGEDGMSAWFQHSDELFDFIESFGTLLVTRPHVETRFIRRAVLVVPGRLAQSGHDTEVGFVRAFSTEFPDTRTPHELRAGTRLYVFDDGPLEWA